MLFILLIFVTVALGQDIELRLGYPSCYYCMPTRNIQYGQWTQWSEWSLCQDNFEATSQTRRRFCLNGIQCQGGDAEEARPCLGVAKDTPLPTLPPIAPIQNNTWTNWQPWSECNGTTQTRTRGCQCDKASNLSECICQGESFQEQTCNNITLPVLQPCATCQQPSPCAQCPPNYALPCYTCAGLGKR